MKNRAILAREGAKTPKKKKKKAATVVDPPEQVKQILKKDPETGKVIDVFPDIESAVVHGFNKANVNIALKKGTKYKGHLWVYSE